MKITFRIECPHCGWGYAWRDDYINVGWLTMKCGHCEQKFYAKITVTGIDVKVLKEPPKDICPE